MCVSNKSFNKPSLSDIILIINYILWQNHKYTDMYIVAYFLKVFLTWIYIYLLNLKKASGKKKGIKTLEHTLYNPTAS